MNAYQKELYYGLLDLTKNVKAFFFKDFKTSNKDIIYRLFNYELASFMNFSEKFAMDARGTMFAIDKQTGNPLKLISLPMKKFFSIGEGDKKELEIGIKDAIKAFIKEDGTLINPYIDIVKNELAFKSAKSDVYVRSDLFKKSLSNEALKEVEFLYQKDFCCNFELTTPENLVKINNKEYKCHLLFIRSMKDGSVLPIRTPEFKTEYPELSKILVKEIPVSDIDINRKDVEGYVIELEDGRFKKVKTLPYLSMVSCINNQEYTNRKKMAMVYYKAFALGMGDEIRHLLHYKNNSPNFRIEEKIAYCDLVEKVVQKTFQPMMEKINKIIEENKNEGKSAIAKAIKEVDSRLVSGAINLFLGKEYDFAGLASSMYSKEIAENEVYTQSEF